MPPKTKAKTIDTRWPSNKATKSAITKFEESFAKDMGFAAVASDKIAPYRVSPTGSLALDVALGIGGLPVGRVIEVWGPEHAGKTTLTMLMVAQAQREFPDKMCAWVDMEQTFDKAWAQKLGVDLKRLWLIENPKTAEDVADATKRFVMSGLCSIVVLDSVGGMISRKEFEKESDEATVAAVAGIVTRMVKQVSPMGKSNDTITVVVNQVRANIGGYGAATQTSGGWALRHITSIKLQVRRTGTSPVAITVSGDSVPVGYELAVTTQKNKCAPYGKTALLWLFNQATDKYGPVGIDRYTETVKFGTDLGIIAGKGTAWLVLPSGERCNGADKAKAYLRLHPDEMNDIRDKVLAALSGEVLNDDEVPDESAQSMADFMAEQDQS